MAKFLTTRGASYELENIIKGAQRWLVLISPFVNIPEVLLQNLKDADRLRVKTILVYGKRQLKPDERSQFEELRNIELHFLENLHAKCFFNSQSMVITSLNLLESSEQKNREMGVLLSATDDKDCYENAVREAYSIINSSEPVDLTGAKIVSSDSKTPQQFGYCIRCKVSIAPNQKRPLCPECYSVWAKHKDPEHEENWCHLCGKSEATTIDKPLCYSCYKKLFS